MKAEILSQYMNSNVALISNDLLVFMMNLMVRNFIEMPSCTTYKVKNKPLIIEKGL